MKLEDIVSIKEKRDKETKNKILFITFEELNIWNNPEVLDILIIEYEKRLRNAETKISIIFNCKKLTISNPLIVMQKIPKVIKLNELACKKIKSSAIIITNQMYISIFRKAIQVAKSSLGENSKFVPYTFCSSNTDALNFTKSKF